jgi:CO/xanthine dehydrogenase FAD-binding subunit
LKPPPFRYERPDTLEEAVSLLADNGDEATVLAGGQSLVPMLNMRLSAPAVLVDINGLPDLDGIRLHDGHLEVGALTRQRALERSSETAACPLLRLCLPYVGHVTTRNRGTVGGSVAHADPAGELPLALVATGGEVEVAGPDGRRRVAAEDLFDGFLTTTLLPGEMVVACRFGVAGEGTGTGFAEAALRFGDFAYASAAAVLTMADGVVAEARVAVGAVADRPLLLPEVAAGLLGTPGDAATRRQVAAAASAAVDPSGSLHAPADYQRHLTGVMVSKALHAAVEEAGCRG